jgi:hypothetical protein
MEKLRNILSDRELWALLCWNLTLLVFYQTEILRTATLIWLFYMQNVFIGLQFFLRIRKLENSMSEAERIRWIEKSGATVSINNTEVSPANFRLSNLFAFNFGLFHFVYAIFIGVITVMALTGSFDTKYLAIGTAFIALNAFFSLQSDYQKDADRVKDHSYLTRLLRIPFIRVFPMHFFILAGIFVLVEMHESVSTTILFLMFIAAKTLSDVLTHVIINKTWQAQRPKAFGGFI